MGLIRKTADIADMSLKAVKNSVKAYNFHANQLDDTMHIADKLNERLREIDPDIDVTIPTSRRLRTRLEERGRLAAQQPHQPRLVPRPRPTVARPPKPTAEQVRQSNMDRWRSLKAQQDYMEQHGRYAYMQAQKMGKFGETTVSYSQDMLQALQNAQNGQLGQMQQNALVAQGADMGEELRNQQLEQIKKMRIKQNEATAPGTNQHRGMDPNKSLMKKMGEETPEERLRRLEAWDEIQRRKVGKVFGRETGTYWRNHPNSLFGFGGSNTNPWSAAAKSDAKRREEILSLRRQLGKTAEVDPYDRLKHLEAKVYAQDRDKYFSQYNPIEKSILTTGHLGANPGGQAAYNRRLRDRLEIRSLRKQLGMKPHGLVGMGKILNDTSDEIERARAAAQAKSVRKTPGTVKPIPKTAAQVDALGKNTSPAMQGAHVEAPMPQTNYAKSTLENEFANRLNKRQLAEMDKLQQQQQQQQSSTTTTTSNGTTTTTTTGLANSGLIAALSLGA